MAVRKTQWLVPYIAHFLKRSALVTTTCFKSPLEKVGKCFVDFSEWERVAELVYEVVAYETLQLHSHGKFKRSVSWAQTTVISSDASRVNS